jgi:lipopolysaccharide export system permease protein
VLAVLFSGLCAYINMELAPRCRAAYKNMLFEIGVSGSLALIPEKQFVRDLPGGYTIYIDKKDGENLRDVFIHQSDDDANVTRWFRAPNGKLVYNETNKIMTLTLYGANGAIQEQDNITPVLGEEMSIELNPRAQKERRQKPKISDMSFTQLREEIADLEELKQQAQPIPSSSPEQLRQQSELIKLWRRDLSMPAKVQLHRMVSFSFACIGFTLIGIPLGIRAHRRETSAGIALALILVLVYYSFIIVGQSLDTHSEFAPHLIVWVPNFLFQAIGAVLLWRANRGI